MAASQEPMRIGWIEEERSCPDCGGPIEASTATEKPFRVCRSCYDAYVENAGR
jgi:hypothetical protein